MKRQGSKNAKMASTAVLLSAPKKEFWVYILELKNGFFYTGYAYDLEKRILQHKKGPHGSKIVRALGLKCLKQAWRCASRSGALRIEAKIKKFSRSKKEQVVMQPEKLGSLLLSFADISNQLGFVLEQEARESLNNLLEQQN